LILEDSIMRPSTLGTALAALAALTGTVHAAERLTVEQAVDLALKQNRRLLAVEKRASAGHDVALATGAHLLPAVRLSEEYQHWDCAAAFSLSRFGDGAVCLEQALKTATADMPPIVARKQDTNSFVASVDQPLLGLLHTGYDFAARRADARSADAGTQSARAAVIQGVKTTFLQYFEARADCVPASAERASARRAAKS
jgi:outer membrane protein TolC